MGSFGLESALAPHRGQLAGALRRRIADAGFAYFGPIDREQILSFSAQLGAIAADHRNPELIRTIRPQRTDSANGNTLSSRFGLGAFPFHTDCAHWEVPARFVLLYCVSPGRAERNTLLVDSAQWRWSTEERSLHRSAVWRRALKFPQLCTFESEAGLNRYIRFDPACFHPMCTDARRLNGEILSRIAESKKTVISWQSEHALIIDNHRMLHARADASCDDEDRTLLRILIGDEP